ncbi:MAG: putative toxin-antitoxin system toxin component, PIN family [Phycisphaerales bacterium]|nr:MAG: putative toxin-antitoxin system toxin component, PIN family [Phycisphaerales bacterium]
MRVVFDTNVLFSAFASRGLCEAVFEVCLASHELVLSKFILDELSRHLDRKARMSPKQSKEVIGFLKRHSILVEPLSLPAEACRDPQDVPILGTAVAGKAEVIVTGDKDLLDLGSFDGVEVLSPRAFYERLL